MSRSTLDDCKNSKKASLSTKPVGTQIIPARLSRKGALNSTPMRTLMSMMAAACKSSRAAEGSTWL